VGPVDRAKFYLGTIVDTILKRIENQSSLRKVVFLNKRLWILSIILILILMYRGHKPIDRINLLDS
jgi:hypothetical protein